MIATITATANRPHNMSQVRAAESLRVGMAGRERDGIHSGRGAAWRTGGAVSSGKLTDPLPDGGWTSVA